MSPAVPKTTHWFVVEDRGFETPCHVWTRAVGSHGYGHRKIEGRTVLAHRHSYEQEYGPIPEGLVVDHLCRQRLCVRASHLEAVTIAENIRRGDKATLSHSDIAVVRERRGRGETTVALAREFGVTAWTISRVARGASWR